MKKIALISGIVLAVILGTIVAVPFLFRDKLLEQTKATINKNLNATIEFKDFDLTLIRHFPKASLILGDVSVTGKNEFEGDTLLWIQSVSTAFSVFDLFSPNSLTLNEIILNNPRLKMLVNAANKANWNIMPETAPNEPTTTKKENSEEFSMQLSKIEINNGFVSYIDHTLPMKLDFNEVNIKLKGNMYGSDTKLVVEGTSSQFNLNYDSANYISSVKLGINSILDINFDNLSFRFTEGEMLVNNLPVNVGGTFSMPADTIYFDLAWASKKSGLGDFLALVPAGYESYLKDMKATGNAELTGSFRGFYFGESYPELKMAVKLADGNIRYSNLPEEIKNIVADMSLNKQQGGFNLTSVEISKAHFDIRSNPLDMSLRMNNLLDDPFFDGKIKGRVNFDDLKSAFPLENMDISGMIDMDLASKGNLSDIENKKYQKLQTSGNISVDDFLFNSKQLTQPVLVSSGKMDFEPETVNLRKLDMKIGRSDFDLTGTLRDYYPYIFSEGTLRGNLQLNAGFLDLNELMALQVDTTAGKSTPAKKMTKQERNSEKAAAAADTVATAFNVPEKIDLTFNTVVKRLLFDNLDISNAKGIITVNNGRIDLKDVNMNMMNGEMKLSGSYANTGSKMPMVDLLLDIVSFDIPLAFQSLQLIRNYLPIAAQSKGKFSTSIKLSGQLTKKMNIVMSSLNGNGLFNSTNVQIINSPTFNKVKAFLNEEKLRDMRIDDFAASFTIANGNLLLKPFKTKLAGQDATIAGRLNIDNIADFEIGFVVQREALSKNIENTLGFLPGQEKIKLIPVGVTIKGPVKNPDVKVDLTEAKALISKEVKNATKEDLQKSINKIGEGLKKLFK